MDIFGFKYLKYLFEVCVLFHIQRSYEQTLDNVLPCFTGVQNGITDRMQRRNAEIANNVLRCMVITIKSCPSAPLFPGACSIMSRRQSFCRTQLRQNKQKISLVQFTNT